MAADDSDPKDTKATRISAHLYGGDARQTARIKPLPSFFARAGSLFDALLHLCGIFDGCLVVRLLNQSFREQYAHGHADNQANYGAHQCDDAARAHSP